MGFSTNFPAIKPTLLLDFANTKALDPRITFTRATTATYYDGVTTAKAEENLFTYSQDFDNAWSKARTTLTPNVLTAPNGTTTADALYEDATTNTHYVNQAFTPNGGAIALSFYAKSGLGRDWVWVRTIASGSNLKVTYFDVTNGVVGTTPTGVTASITSVGDGWCRCVVVTAASNTTTDAWGFGPALADGVSNYAGDITKGIYIWGAQLEQRSSVTAYTATTTQAITNYIPALQTAASGVPRFDHNPITDESLGLLIEEQRTNLLTYSEDFSNAAWTKGGCSVSANAIVAPDGTLTGDRLVEDTTNGDHRAFQLSSFTSGTAYTFTVYAKQAGRSLLQLANTMAGGYIATFDLAAGTVSNTATGTATITNVGNGWYRCSVSNTSTFTGNSNNQIRLVNTGTNTSYTGDGWSGVFVWGAQLEAGAFATSYIPTVAASVTRNADAASMTGTNFSSWYNAGEGTLFAEAAHSNSSNFPVSAMITTSSGTADQIVLYTTSSGTPGETFFVRAATAVQANINGGNIVADNTRFRIAGAYKVNDFAVSLNGASAVTDTSGTIPVVDRLYLGASLNQSSLYLNGAIRKIAYYPIRVTNANLQALTS
jgi:hypothetical protein